MLPTETPYIQHNSSDSSINQHKNPSLDPEAPKPPVPRLVVTPVAKAADALDVSIRRHQDPTGANNTWLEHWRVPWQTTRRHLKNQLLVEQLFYAVWKMVFYYFG